MAEIYQLMIGKKQINGVIYYDAYDAFSNARQLSVELGEPVEIWETEEHEVIPYDLLDWVIIGVVKGSNPLKTRIFKR